MKVQMRARRKNHVCNCPEVVAVGDEAAVVAKDLRVVVVRKRDQGTAKESQLTRCTQVQR